MRVLLVEDDAVIANQISAVLTRERFQVDLASNGEDGLDQGLSRTYNLIILDVMLPRRDGWSICDELRRLGVTTPILMLTARDTVDDRVRGLEGGADDYLAKPFDVRELLARIHALLRRDKIHR